jgi:hypothetical protein
MEVARGGTALVGIRPSILDGTRLIMPCDFPSTATYAWINHRQYGFPANLVKPQKAYLSLSPPPLSEGAAQLRSIARRVDKQKSLRVIWLDYLSLAGL